MKDLIVYKQNWYVIKEITNDEKFICHPLFLGDGIPEIITLSQEQIHYIDVKLNKSFLFEKKINEFRDYLINKIDLGLRDNLVKDDLFQYAEDFMEKLKSDIENSTLMW